MIPRAAIAAAALEEVDTPYLHQARLPGKALDCAGLLIVISWRFGIKPRSFDVTGYTGTADGSTLQAYCEEHLVRLAPGAEQIGDVVLTDWGRLPTHFGILVPYLHGGLAIVHALGPASPARVRLSRWLPRMRPVAAYGFPGVG